MAGTNAKQLSPLVAAAAAFDEALRAYDDLAREAQQIKIENERGLRRAVAIVQESGECSERIAGHLRVLLSHIEGARARQVESLDALLQAARTVEMRAHQHGALMQRFAALGDSAQHVNTLAAKLSEDRNAGATEEQLFAHLGSIQEHITAVVAEAEALSSRATEEHWPDVARQADAVRQQVLSAKNKLALALKTIAARGSS